MMGTSSIKQEQLGAGETSGVLERLHQCKKKIVRLEEQVLASTRGQCSPAAECMGPGWVPQSTAPDTHSQDRPQATQAGSS
ncbi:UNVERIFIED_CONTAM: hypothetical protein FKN15_057733 [Acipenser sinensis]